jgi:hypothetical protein
LVVEAPAGLEVTLEVAAGFGVVVVEVVETPGLEKVVVAGLDAAEVEVVDAAVAGLEKEVVVAFGDTGAAAGLAL